MQEKENYAQKINVACGAHALTLVIMSVYVY